MTGIRFTIMVQSSRRTRAFGMFNDLGQAEKAHGRIAKALEGKGYMVAVIAVFPQTSGVQVAEALGVWDGRAPVANANG